MSAIDYFVNEDNVQFVENRGIFGPQYDQVSYYFNILTLTFSLATHLTIHNN